MEIEGYVVATLFNNSSTGYTVLVVKPTTKINNENVNKITVTGNFPKLDNNYPYVFIGELVLHPKYGRQFRASSYRIIENKTKASIIKYLSSDIFKGIGPSTAKKIYDLLQEDALEKILADKQVLKKINLSDKKIDAIYMALKENYQTHKIIEKLSEFAMPMSSKIRLVQDYSFRAYEVIKDNPYILFYDYQVPFLECEKIFIKDHDLDDKRRIEAGIIYLLSEQANNGNTCIKKVDLVNLVLKRLYSYNNLDDLYDIIKNMLERKVLVTYKNKIALFEFYDAEVNISIKLKSLKRTFIEDSLIKEKIDLFEKSQALDYTVKQKQAAVRALTNSFSIITGTPGSGKTTILKLIVELFKSIYDFSEKNIALIAPTGKAAMRMKESCHQKAQTVHRFLGFTEEKVFSYGKNRHVKEKVIIVDEASMLDSLLCSQLLESIDDDCFLIFIGDVEQLPSVYAGNVLADLIYSESFTVTFLKTIFRQAKNSNIIKLATSIIAEELDLKTGSDVIAVEANKEEIVTKIKEIYVNHQDVQTLIPMYKGITGIDNINMVLEDYLNDEKAAIEYRNFSYKKNDKVIQLVNRFNDGIMNGDVGIITSIDLVHDKITVKYDEASIVYSRSNFNEIRLAYALSVHKSQGSEYDNVVFIISRAHTYMLRKKLIYTAVTRAKKRLYLLGDINLLASCIKRHEPKRITMLKEMLLDEKNSRD